MFVAAPFVCSVSVLGPGFIFNSMRPFCCPASKE